MVVSREIGYLVFAIMAAGVVWPVLMVFWMLLVKPGSSRLGLQEPQRARQEAIAASPGWQAAGGRWRRLPWWGKLAVVGGAIALLPFFWPIVIGTVVIGAVMRRKLPQ